jgi:uncharacterized membrane protein
LTFSLADAGGVDALWAFPRAEEALGGILQVFRKAKRERNEAMKTGWRIEGPMLALVAAMFALAALSWSTAPDRIPVHWNIAGEVDRYGGRFEGLLLPPTFALGTYLLMRFLPRVDPHRANYAAFGTAYTIFRFAMLVVLASVYAVVHLAIRGHEVHIETVGPLMLAALFILIGAISGKLRPNWFIGIRTPWTLSSERSWVRSHRVGGWLFVLLGVAILLAVPMLGPRSVRYILPIGIGGILVWSFVYSYLVWRTDPDKLPPADTPPADPLGLRDRPR